MMRSSFRSRRSKYGLEQASMEQLEGRRLLAAVSWDGDAGDNLWHTPSNWSNNLVPTIADDVTIDVASSPTIQFTGATGNRSVNSLLTREAITLSGGTLTVATTASVQAGAAVALSGGALSGGAWNVTGGSLASSNGALTNVAITGDVALNASGVLTVGGTTTFGTVHVGNAAILQFAPGYTLVNTVAIDGAGTSTRTVRMNGSSGTLTIGATGQLLVAAGIAGPVSINNGNGAMTLVNNGVIEMQGTNTLTISAASFTNAATLRLMSGAVMLSATAWTNTGTIAVSGGTFNIDGTFNTAGGIGGWNRTGGTVAVTGTVNNAGGTIALTAATGGWNLNGGGILGGALTLAGGAQLTSTSGGLSGVAIAGDVTINSSGSVNLGGATTFGTLHVGNASVLQFAPGYTLLNTVAIDAAGTSTRTIRMSGSAGAVTIAAGGQILVAPGIGAPVSINNGNGSMTLVNNGLIEMQGTNTLTISTASFTNAGTLRLLSGGILMNATAWTNPGMIVMSGGTFSIDGGFDTSGGVGGWSRTGGTVSVTGTVNNTGGTIALTAATGSWNLNGGGILGGALTLAGGAQLTSTSGGLSGVAIAGDVTINSSGSLNLGGATTFGTLYVGNSSVLQFVPGYTLVNTVLMNSAGTSTRTMRMNGTAGTLTIGATGRVLAEAGMASPVSINNGNGAMTLVNNGLIEMQGTNTMTIGASSFTNAATLRLTGGGMVVSAAAWTNTGTIAVSGGTFGIDGTFNTAGGIGGWNRTGGTVSVVGAVNNVGGTIALTAATGSWNLNGGSISGGQLTYAGGAQLTSSSGGLSGVAIAGDVTINATGSVNLAGATTFATLRVGNSSVLQFAPGYTLVNTVLMDGPGASTRTIRMNGAAGTVTIGAAGQIVAPAGMGSPVSINNGNGAMTLVNNGLIEMQGTNTLTISAASLTNAGTLRVTGGTMLVSAAAWTNAGTIAVSGGTFNIDGTFSTSGGIGGWNRTGGTVGVTGTVSNAGGTVALTAATGTWNINGGAIVGGAVTFAGGAQLTSTSGTVRDVAISGSVGVNASGSVTLAGSTSFVSVDLANASIAQFEPGYVVHGTVQAVGAGTSVRTVRMNGSPGTLTVASDGVIRTAPGAAGGLSINNGNGTMTLVNNGLIAALASGQTLSVQPGTFTQAGEVKASGGGRVLVTQAVFTNGGAITLGPGGVLQTSGDLVLAANSVVTIEIAGEAASQYGRIIVGGAAQLGGTLTAAFMNGYEAPIISKFDFLTSTGATTGVFASAPLPAPGQDGKNFLLYTERGASICISSLADFNSDGQVDFFDYLDFASAFANEDPSGDFNGDGQIDFFDYLDFVQMFSRF